MAPGSPRILKPHTARELAGATTFNFEDLRQQALAQLTAAENQAQAIRAQAEQEAAVLKQAAQTEGREAGRTEGLKNAATHIEQQANALCDRRFTEHLQRTLPALTKAAQQLQQERDHWLVRWEKVAVELGVAIAEKLVRSNLAAKPELATGMISEALRLAAGQPQLRVFLHPDDLARLGDQAQQVVQSLSACATPDLVSDATLAPGDCRLETRHGEIDARLETMLHRITEELLAA